MVLLTDIMDILLQKHRSAGATKYAAHEFYKIYIQLAPNSNTMWYLRNKL